MQITKYWSNYWRSRQSRR